MTAIGRSICAFRCSIIALASNPHPDVVPLIDTHKEGWKGLNALFGADREPVVSGRADGLSRCVATRVDDA